MCFTFSLVFCCYALDCVRKIRNGNRLGNKEIYLVSSHGCFLASVNVDDRGLQIHYTFGCVLLAEHNFKNHRDSRFS